MCTSGSPPQRGDGVRLTTFASLRSRAEIPNVRGFTASFRIFPACLGRPSNGRIMGLVVEAIAEHMKTMLHGLDLLERHGFAFPDRRITVLATEECAALGDRIVAMIAGPPASRAVLDHPYYNKGLRFQIAARSSDGDEVPLVDGGAFDWVARLASNRKAVYVASGLGSQLVADVRTSAHRMRRSSQPQPARYGGTVNRRHPGSTLISARVCRLIPEKFKIFFSHPSVGSCRPAIRSSPRPRRVPVDPRPLMCRACCRPRPHSRFVSNAHDSTNRLSVYM